jgi:PhnB protein
MKAAHPYLNFNGNTEEAFNFYRSVFGGDFPMVLRFRDMGDGMGAKGDDLDKIAHIALPLGETMLMGTDLTGSRSATMGDNFYINVSPDSAEEAETVFNRLAEGGAVEMPLQETEWAERFGSCIDRFGIQWMVNYEGRNQFRGPQGSGEG